MGYVIIGLLAVFFLWWLLRRKKSSDDRRSAITTIAPDPPPAGDRHTFGPESQPAPEKSQPAPEIGESRWIPPGQTVNVHGLELPGGMLYVGAGLRGENIGHSPVEPALINPALPIDRHQPDYAGHHMGYWPSYAAITPASRAAYLEWLAHGRPAGAYIGYVFLFFYGIERRVLVDAGTSAQAHAEIPTLLTEVERLFELYASNDSFRSYASGFLAVARVVQGISDEALLIPPRERSGWDFPVDLKLALARFVDRGQPIPGEWALSWLLTHPEVHLRTPATRCPEEFQQLFLLRYTKQYGSGMKVARNKMCLQVSYHPASPTFGQSVTLDVGDLPDVTRLTAPVTKLRALAEHVCDELDDYSRWVGRHVDHERLAALALLPAEIADTRGGIGEMFFAWIDEQLGDAGSAFIQTDQLLSHWSSDPPGNLTKRDATRLASLLERHGVGIEPDIRFTGINLPKTEKLVAFRLPNRDTIEPSDAYRTTTALLHLGAAVVAADGRVLPEEVRHLEQYVENTAQFSAAERTHLRAYICWLLETSPGFTGLKQRCSALDVEQRQQIGRFLIGIAGADGHLAPEELTILGKIYRLLGLDPDDVFREVHALAVGSGGPATEPVLIAPDDHATPTYRIPHPKQETPAGSVTLAPERVAAIMAETHAVAAILGTVFTDNDLDPSEPEQKGPDDPENDSIAGLDALHSNLVRHLAKQPSWHRYEFDELTSRLGMMPAGAIETINETAFEIGGAPLLEEDDPIEVNAEVLKELMA